MDDLHQLDTVGRFDDRAADYVKYRPTYPAEAIDTILKGLGPPQRLLAVDIGAGTGISARLLADRGVHVIAVEPGEAMRGAAEPHDRVRERVRRIREQQVEPVAHGQPFGADGRGDDGLAHRQRLERGHAAAGRALPAVLDWIAHRGVALRGQLADPLQDALCTHFAALFADQRMIGRPGQPEVRNAFGRLQRDQARQAGAGFLGVLIESRGREYQIDRANLERLLRARGLPWLSLDNVAADWPRLRYPRDQHWNEAGHRTVGTLLAGPVRRRLDR